MCVELLLAFIVYLSYNYVGYTLIGALWKEAEIEVAGLGFPLTNEPITNKEPHIFRPTSARSMQRDLKHCWIHS